MAKVKYALISPTFKRPDEVTEFLASLEQLDYPKDQYQVILGDGTQGMNCARYFRSISIRCRFKSITKSFFL